MKAIVVGTKKIPVYAITVENTHEYFANGILVANSLLYAMVGMQKYGDQMAKIVDGADIWGGLKRGIIADDSGVILGARVDL